MILPSLVDRPYPHRMNDTEIAQTLLSMLVPNSALEWSSYHGQHATFKIEGNTMFIGSDADEFYSLPFDLNKLRELFRDTAFVETTLPAGTLPTAPEPDRGDIETRMTEKPHHTFYTAREELRDEWYGGKPPHGHASWGDYWKSI
jgi:hypothetical protein